MEAVFAGFAVGVIMGQGVAHRGEGQLFPRHFRFVEQTHFQALGSGAEIEIEQAGAEQDVDLIDVRNVVHRIQRSDFDAGTGFLQGFARRTLRRGFALERGETVVVVEDVVTTGKSTREVIAVVEAAGARVIGIASLIDRSSGKAGFEVPFESLQKLAVDAWAAGSCPLCAAGSSPTKPGSRPGA